MGNSYVNTNVHIIFHVKKTCIINQCEHHKKRTAQDEFRHFLEKHNLISE